MKIPQYEPVDLHQNNDLLQRIKRFEEELSSELHMPVSVVAYVPSEEQQNS